MSTYTLLKVIAFISMVIDHVGLVYGVSWMRLIGRIAMPIFALFMGYGSKKTKHEGKRVLKLGITAAISLPLTMYTFNETRLNILVSFFFFALVIWLLKKVKLNDEKWRTPLEVISMLCLCVISLICDFDYTFLLPILCYVGYKFEETDIIFAAYTIAIFIYPYLKEGFTSKLYVGSLGVAAMPLIIWFLETKDINKGRKIYKSKFLTWLSRNIFYILYPLHVFVILLVKTYIWP